MKTLRAARTDAGLSQQQAAALFGVHYQTLAKWEKDNSRMPYEMIAKIPDVYGTRADEIFFGPENEFIRSKRSVFNQSVNT